MKKQRQSGPIAADSFDEADDSGLRLGGRIAAGFTFALLLVAGAGGWAATAQLTGAVIAPGTVNVDQNLKAVQHRDGGIISEIATKEGDVVKEGEVLIRLDDAQTRAELAIVRAQLAEASVRRARLVAERDGLETLVVADAADLSSHLTVPWSERQGCSKATCGTGSRKKNSSSSASTSWARRSRARSAACLQDRGNETRFCRAQKDERPG